VISTVPASGTGTSQTFAITVADGGGPSNMATVYFVVNAALLVTNSCVVSYSRASNALFLLNDAGDWATSSGSACAAEAPPRSRPWREMK
jgi:hypothetical protein